MDIINNSLPALAVRGICPIPNSEIRIEVGRENSIKAIEDSEKANGGNICLLIQKNPTIEVPSCDDLENVGLLAKIVMKIKLPGGSLKVKFKIIERITINSFELVSPFFKVSYQPLQTVIGDQDEELALVRLVINQVIDNPNVFNTNSQEIIKEIQGGLSSEVLCDVVASNIKTLDRVKYVREPELNKRLRFILEDIGREKQISYLENKINEDVKKSIDESQKEYYLREKMRAIQNELGDKARQEEEVDALRKKILDAHMPKNIEEKALQELKRFGSTPPSVAESGIIKAYLDFLVALPWDNASVDCTDLKLAKELLDKHHYGLDKVKNRIVEYLAVKIMTGRNPQTILCLVGPPGVGKTSLATSIAEALGRKFVKQSLGGVHDESEIRGHRRTYIGALPGRILKGMKEAGTVNPVFLLDEIDKMASDYKGDPASAMLEVLDPEQNAKFSDHYVEEPYDLSQVLFITTANYLENIPAPLRDRMEIVQLSSYTEIEKFHIAREHLIGKQLALHGLKEEQFTITDEAIYEVIQKYTREAGVRSLDRQISALIRKAIKDILIDKLDNVYVDVNKVHEYLGKTIYDHTLAEEKSQVGVVTGLAYTEFGGDILPIEVTYYHGKGGLVLTGKLGDVMKESAMAALSFVKSHADHFGIDYKLFEENDIHIHVPEGAVPKDGPSAGVTMATAIVSALTNRVVRNDLGMTGEITLRGYVLPIGGLREKSIAAHRSGLHTILIPKENQRDIDEIPEEVRNNLEIIPVDNVDDVIKYAFK